jgi:ATP-dependent Lhr-like helicase
VERLRSQRVDAETAPLVLAATDPAQPYGAALPWPKKGPQRASGALVVLHGAEPAVFAERGGKGLLILTDNPRPALTELAHFVLADRKRKLSLERVDGEPVVGSDWEALLIELGFRAGPRKLTLSA